MPFETHFLNASVVPHVFSRLDDVSKSEYRRKYAKMKKYTTVSTLSAVSVADGSQLVKDLISSKLKAYGYKSVFAITLGPILQFASLPLYVFSYGSKVRKIALATTEIGAKITAGEMSVVNWAWIFADLALFGEPVPILNETSLMIFNNETYGRLGEIVEEIGGQDG